jgi:hypothetical protein
MRLAYLAPAALERMVIEHIPTALQLPNLIAATLLPWEKQERDIFEHL